MPAGAAGETYTTTVLFTHDLHSHFLPQSDGEGGETGGYARLMTALERAGISARILRSPKSIAGEGCSHCVKISQRSLPDALRILRRVDLTPKRIFITAGDGSYQEVEL